VPLQSQKRPKSNLQLIEPPEKSKQQRDMLQPVEQAMDEYLANEDLDGKIEDELVEQQKFSPSNKATNPPTESSPEHLQETLSNLNLNESKR